MYVPPIHVDLVHFLSTWGAYVPFLHGYQHIARGICMFSHNIAMRVQRTYKSYTKFHQAWQATQIHGNSMVAWSCRFITKQ